MIYWRADTKMMSSLTAQHSAFLADETYGFHLA